MQGSGSGEIIQKGSAENSILYKVLFHFAEPTMPPKKDRLDDELLTTIKQWIDAGAPEQDARMEKETSTITLSALGSQLTTSRPTPSTNIVFPSDNIFTYPILQFKLPLAKPVISDMAHSGVWPLLAVENWRQVLIYSSISGHLQGAIPFSEGRPAVIQWLAGDQQLLIAGGEGARSGMLVIWDMRKNQRVWSWNEEIDQILGADASPDLKLVALGGPSKVLKIVSTAKHEMIYSIKKHTEWITQCAFSPDGILLASADRNGGLYIWETDSGELLYELNGHKKSLTGLAWTPDSNTLGSISEDGDFKLWSMQKGRLLQSNHAHDHGGLGLAMCDPTWVTCGRDHRVVAWDTNGKKLSTSAVLNDLPTSVALDLRGQVWVGFLHGGMATLSPQLKPVALEVSKP